MRPVVSQSHQPLQLLQSLHLLRFYFSSEVFSLLECLRARHTGQACLKCRLPLHEQPGDQRRLAEAQLFRFGVYREAALPVDTLPVRSLQPRDTYLSRRGRCVYWGRYCWQCTHHCLLTVTNVVLLEVISIITRLSDFR